MPISLVGGVITPGPPTLLFTANFFTHNNGNQSYDVAADGRFIMIESAGDPEIWVKTGWLEAACARAEPAE